MPQALDWERDGQDWPHRDRSRQVAAGDLIWHVQTFAGPAPRAPVALLLHGTGASTHSWRAVAPALARHCEVIAVDLPGHAFTAFRPGARPADSLSLTGMAAQTGELLRTLGVQPDLLLGHSAGAALAVRMVLDDLAAPRALVGVNAALLPLRGLPAHLFAPAARLLAASPFVPRLFARRAADPAVLRRLIASTGSTLDAEGLACWSRLVAHPGHAAGALGMMANWDLPALQHDLPRVATPLFLVVGTGDLTVSPREASRVLRLLQPSARRGVIELPGLGHLAHEEQPARVAGIAWDCHQASAAPG